MQDSHLVRAEMLLGQNRHAEAEKELKQALSGNPENHEIQALLAICLAYQEKTDEALQLIRSALAHSADNPRYLYFLANIHLIKEDYSEAQKVIQGAIAIYPESADYYATLAQIMLAKKNWKEALNAAEKGLELDADNLNCLNCRSTALIKLDDKEEAYSTIEEALRKDPENAYTHANLGWGLLEKGESKRALEHFRKALMVNPEMDYAKAGMVEALKARYFVYRMFLRYVFWIGNMKGKAQWGVIIGFYVLSRLLRWISNSHPEFAVITTPIFVLYMLFAFSTWVLNPLSNLFLRLNVYGRYALNKDQILSSNLVGLSLSVALISGIAYWITDSTFLATTGIIGLSLMIPLSATFNVEKGKKRKAMVLYTLLLALIGIFAVYQSYEAKTEFPGIMMIYILGVIGYQWVANFLIVKV